MRTICLFLTRTALVLIAIALVLSACSETDASRVLDGTATTTTTDNRIYAALMNTASKNDPEAYKIATYSAAALDPTSVKFCFDQQAACQAGTSTVVMNGVAQDVGGGHTVYLTEKFIKLQANVSFYIVAKDSLGTPLIQLIRVVPKGTAPAVVPGTTPPVTPPTTPITPGTTPVTPATTPITPGTTPLDQVGGAQPGSNCYKAPDPFTCQVENEIVRLTNVKRATESQGPLNFEPKMGFVARLWSVDQANRGNIGHEWFVDGTWAQKYQAEFNAQSPALAENVAMNGGGGDNSPTAIASAFVEQWWASEGHHRNMVGPYAQLGVGVAKAADGSWYGTQDFSR